MIYYQKNGITIYHGDCMDIMKGFGNESFDIVLTDPPYGISYRDRNRKHDKIANDDSFNLLAVHEFFRLASRAVYVFCRWDNLSELPKPKSFLVWVKNNHTIGDLKHAHGRQWEGIAFYPQKNHRFIRRIPDVLHAKKTGNELHPTQKPVSILSEILKSNEGNSILDPYMGSGSTLMAAHQLGRRAVGIEISEKYCEIAARRLEQIDFFWDNK